MKTHFTIAATIVAATSLMAGCSSYDQRPMAGGQYPTSAPATSTYGVIDSIQVVQGASSGGTSGVGTVAGGVVGGALGNQVGSGRGRTAATVAGAIGGAVVGNQMEKNARGTSSIYQIGVRLDNGSYQTIQQDSIDNLQVGNRVRIENNHVYRY
jgi:outer membrane lipoprotein SlyB